jgi:hypothetical protein
MYTKDAVDMLNEYNRGEEQRQQMLKELGIANRYPGLEQLICAALADPDLAAQLLKDPVVALDHISASIHLSPIEYQLVASMSGTHDIHDFASRLHAKAWQVGSDDI